MALPVVGNGQGEFDAFTIRVAYVANDANLLDLALLVGNRGDESHFTVVVDLGEAHQHGLRQLAQGVHEAVILAFLRESFDKGLFEFGILWADRPDGYRPAVGLVPFLCQMAGVGVYRHVRIAIAFVA